MIAKLKPPPTPLLGALIAGWLLIPRELPAQIPVVTSTSGSAPVPARPTVAKTGDLPTQVTGDHFSMFLARSPFLRLMDNSKSLIITGVARIDGEPVATLHDLQTGRTSVVSRHSESPEGWQLVEVTGDLSDVESLSAKIKLAGGSEIVSIRYEKAPPGRNPASVVVSSRVGNGTAGGGTNPHGGPDPRVLTPDQMNDARNAARNVTAGFKADGYGDGQTIPAEVVSKISRLSVEQRESINVKMYEYRNRGLGMQDRQQIYHRMLDQALRQ